VKDNICRSYAARELPKDTYLALAVTAATYVLIALGVAATAVVLVVFAVDTLRNAPQTFAAIVVMAALAVRHDVLWISGTQSKVSNPFELSAGLLRVEASHEGEGSIWIDLVDAPPSPSAVPRPDLHRGFFASLRLAAGQFVREATQALLAREGAQWSLVLAPLLPRSFACRISSSGFGFLAASGRRPLE